MSETTEWLLSAWLFLKIAGIVLGILTLVIALVFAWIINLPEYTRIHLDDEEYWYRYKWVNGCNSAWLYKKRKYFGMKQVSGRILCSGLWNINTSIKKAHKEGDIEWIQQKKE